MQPKPTCTLMRQWCRFYQNPAPPTCMISRTHHVHSFMSSHTAAVLVWREHMPSSVSKPCC
jgi:hypothetical protein